MSAARTKSYALLLLVSALWGIAGPIIKYTLAYLPPDIFLSYRFALSTLIGLAILSATHHPHWPTHFKGWLEISLYAFLTSTVSLGLLFLGYAYTTALSGSVLNAIQPILIAAVGVRLLHEHVTKRERLGLIIALIGTAFIILEPLITQDGSGKSDFFGNLLVVASLLVGVALAVLAKMISRNSEISSSTLTHFSFIIGFITLIPFTFILHPLPTVINYLSTIPLSAHLGVWYMALISGTLAYTLWHQAQKTIEIGETAVFVYTYPIFTLPLSLFWLHEQVTWFFIAGSIVIAIGVFISETKRRSSSRNLAKTSSRKHRR